MAQDGSTSPTREAPPTGAVTFLSTEVEVPALALVAPEVVADALARHHTMVAGAVVAHGGVPGDRSGDGDGRAAVALFGSAPEAVAAALDVQRAVIADAKARARAGAGAAVLPVRVGLHTAVAPWPPAAAAGPPGAGSPAAGAPHAARPDAARPDAAPPAGAEGARARAAVAPGVAGEAVAEGARRCARLREVAHGGQVLLSAATASVVAGALPDGAWLNDLGARRLRDLSRPEQVFELRHGETGADLPPLRSLDVLPNNLPIQLTSFVGRRDELATLGRVLDAERLVTLTGPGGAGKTRLALQVAAAAADSWPDGVWWVDLSPVTDPGLVAELVASAAGVLVEPVGGALRALTLQLRDRRPLVCLDNCEHLLEGAAELAEALLRSCPEVSVLATSREPLGVAGENVWPVPSLVEDEAVSLFVERGGRARPGFALGPSNEAAVRTLCRRLDGIPLAIELAASWLRALTPAQIVGGLDDRFSILVGGPRGASARQQTLAASIDWSHDLLDEADRVVFRRLAAFSGGFTLDAARSVCAAGPISDIDVLTGLGRLVDKSLVVADERDGEARYRLLETIRQYARDRLEAAGELDEARDRHLDHFLAFAEAAEPHLVDAEQDVWLARAETEHDNLRAALDWGLAPAATSEGADRGRRMAAALFWLWYLHGHPHEGIDFLERAIERAPEERSTVQATLLAGIAAVAIGSKQFSLIADYAQKGLEVATSIGDHRNRGRCLLLLGVIQHYLDFESSRQLLAAAGESAAEAGDAFVTDRVAVMQGVLWSCRDRYDEAGPRLAEGLARCERRGDRGFVALALDYQVDAALSAGDLREALALATRAVQVAEPLGDYFSVGLATGHLAYITGLTGDVEAGHAIMGRIVRSVEGAEHDVFVPRMGTFLGHLALWSGNPGEALGWFRRDLLTGPMSESRLVVRALPGLAAALRHLGAYDEAAERVEAALALGRKLDTPRLVADALEEAGHLAAVAADHDRAEDLHHEALALRVDYGVRAPFVCSLDALGRLAAEAESFAEAARLLAASDEARRAMGYPRPAIDVPGHDATVAGLRSALGDGAFAEAWAEGGGLGLDDAVAYARRSRGERKRPSSGWASLTPTEHEVVRAVVDGLTNPEIGARLFMSRGTVKTHLSHVYAKLGVANRTELATVAARHPAAP